MEKSLNMENKKYCVVVVKFDNGVKKSTEPMPIQMAKDYIKRFVGKQEECEVFECTHDGEQLGKIDKFLLGGGVDIVEKPDGAYMFPENPTEKSKGVKMGVGGTMDSSEDANAPILGGTMGSSMRMGGKLNYKKYAKIQDLKHEVRRLNSIEPETEAITKRIKEIKLKIEELEKANLRDGGNLHENQPIDLFEKYDELPVNVQEVISKYDENDYETMGAMQNELEALGYTFDWYLDAEPYNLRKMKLGANIGVNKKYTHFAVRKSDGKILTAWETISDVESLKYYAKEDLKDLDINPKDIKILSKAHLIKNGVNPFDWESWAKSGEMKTGGTTSLSNGNNYLGLVFSTKEQYNRAKKFYDGSGRSYFYADDYNDEFKTLFFKLEGGDTIDTLEYEVEKELQETNLVGWHFTSEKYKNGGNIEDSVTNNNFSEFKKLPPQGYTFSKKKMTALATRRLGGYWLNTANMNEKRQEIKADKEKGLTISDFDNDWLVKYSNAQNNCFAYLKNNGFLKKALREGGNLKEASVVQTEISGLKVQKEAIMRGDGLPNKVTKMLGKKINQLTKEEQKLKDGGTMNTPICVRCGGATNGTTTMSMFNEEVICMPCKEKERNHPDYKKAVDADNEVIKGGNYNFKGIGLKKKDNDDVSQYYDNEFAAGTFVPNIKQKQIITEKIGLSEQNADYLIGISPKFAVWLADIIVKDEIRDYKVGLEAGVQVEATESKIKQYVLNKINERNNWISTNYSRGIRRILDWLMHPLTPKQNLRELNFLDAFNKSEIWHEELKTLGGDVDYVEPKENLILKRYPKTTEGIEYYWVQIPKSFCDTESKRMGHCGRTGASDLISLRSIIPYGKGHTLTDSHVTIAWDEDEALFYQVKGKKNQKPSKKYHDYIFDIIKGFSGDEDHKFKGFGVEYDPKEDYGFDDMSKEQVLELYEINSNIFNDFEGEALLYSLSITDKKPNTVVIIEKDAKYVVDLLSTSKDLNEKFVEQALTGEDLEWFDGNWSYHYNNYKDLIGNLDKENVARVVKEIMRITKHTKKKVLENGIYEYTLGNVDDFHEDLFDNIVRAMANATSQAEQDAYMKYYNKQIKSALEELGTIKKLDYEGLVLEVDLSDSLTNRQISGYLKNVDRVGEKVDLSGVFFEALSDGEIETPKLSIDDRYTPYTDDKEFNAILKDIGLQDGYKLGGKTKK